jgi:UDP-glucose 4-epimerase
MRIVVTGASGNVGTAVLDALAESGEHRLVGISRREPPAAPPYSGAEWVCTDIGAADATETLREAFAGADAVVHLAWQLQPFRDRGRAEMRRTNVDGTAAVVAAAGQAGVAHLVHQSSIGAYGPGPKEKVDETWPATGVSTSTYSVDKAAAERIVSRAPADMVVTRMRPALILQDESASEVSRYFLGPLIPPQLLRRGLLRFAPFPDALAFQVVHTEDAAAAIRLVLHKRAGGAFNVAASPVIDRAAFREIFGGVGPPVSPAMIRALAWATWRARLQPTEPGWIDMAAEVPLLDTGRLIELGWSATRDAKDVLSRFVDAMRRGAGRPGPLLEPRGGRAAGPTS